MTNVIYKLDLLYLLYGLSVTSSITVFILHQVANVPPIALMFLVFEIVILVVLHSVFDLLLAEFVKQSILANFMCVCVSVFVLVFVFGCTCG